MPDVFISYSRKDKAFAEELHKKLENAQLDAWRDLNDIPGGVDWNAEIYKAIEDANAFIFIISENSIRSDNCQKELDHAVTNKKRLIPIVFQEVDREFIPQDLSSRQFIDFQTCDEEISTEALDKLLIAIKTDWDWVNLHTGFQRRALDWTKSKKNKGSLLRETELTTAENWLQSNPSSELTPTNDQIEYIQQSRKEVNRRLRMTLSGVIIALVVAVALTIFSIIQRNNAIAAEHVASTAQVKAEDALYFSRVGELVNQSELLKETDLFHASIIAIEAMKRANTYEVYSNLLDLYLSSARINQIIWGHSKRVNSLQFSQDGRYFATAGEDGKILLFDLLKQDVISVELIGHSGPVRNIAFHPNNKNLLSSSEDRTVILWDVDTREVVYTYQIPDDVDCFEEIAYSPDGKYLVLGSWNSTQINILDGNTLTLLFQFQNGTNTGSLEVKKDDDILAVGGTDGNLYLWKIYFDENQSTVEINKLMDPIAITGGSITDLEYNAIDNTLIVSSERNPTITFLDVTQNYHILGSLGHGEPVMALALHSSGNLLATGGLDGAITIFYLPDSTYFTPPWKASSSVVTSLEFYPQGDILSTTGYENSSILWTIWPKDIGREKFIQNYSNRVIFIPNSNYFVTGDMNGEITVYDKISKEQLGRFSGHSDIVSCLSTDESGKFIITGGLDQKILIRDTRTFDVIEEINLNTPPDSYIMKINVSPDQNYLAIIFSNGFFTYWNRKIGKAMFENILLANDGVYEAKFSPDGKILAVGSQNGALIFMDPKSLAVKVISEIAHNKPIDNLAFSTDGKVVISSSYDGTINTWMVDGLELYYTLTRAPKGDIEDIALMPNSTILAIADVWGYELWDINEDKSITRLKNSLTKSGLEVTFDDTGKYLAGVYQTGSVVIWDMNPDIWVDALCSTIGRNLNKDEWEFYFWDDEYHETCPIW